MNLRNNLYNETIIHYGIQSLFPMYIDFVEIRFNFRIVIWEIINRKMTRDMILTIILE